MTRKKPAGMSHESRIDQLIREAERRGEFDNLPGAGIGKATSETTVRRLVAEINAKITDVNRTVTSGPPSNLAPLDPDAVVRRWRAGNVS